MPNPERPLNVLVPLHTSAPRLTSVSTQSHKIVAHRTAEFLGNSARYFQTLVVTSLEQLVTMQRYRQKHIEAPSKTIIREFGPIQPSQRPRRRRSVVILGLAYQPGIRAVAVIVEPSGSHIHPVCSGYAMVQCVEIMAVKMSARQIGHTPHAQQPLTDRQRPSAHPARSRIDRVKRRFAYQPKYF